MISQLITAEDAQRMVGNDHFNVVEQRLALTVVTQAEQIASLKRAYDQAWDRLREANGRAADAEDRLADLCPACGSMHEGDGIESILRDARSRRAQETE